jgi:putative FmdB family regulatory protein
MPIYAYRCRQCGEEFEKLVLSAARADEVLCPCCQGQEVERRPALFGLGGASPSGSAANRSCSPTFSGG